MNVRKREKIRFVIGMKFYKKSSGLLQSTLDFLMRYFLEANSLARFTMVSIGFASLLCFIALIYV